jgi:hypothetical protein
MEKLSNILVPSPLKYDYITIRITQSRLTKGLIAIPVGLSEWFPEKNRRIQVYLNKETIPEQKHFSYYKSSARENRIEGLAEWFAKNKIKSGEEIVLQVIDERNFIYRLATEKDFVRATQELENNLDYSRSDIEASKNIDSLSEWTTLDKRNVVINEYLRLAKYAIQTNRRFTRINSKEVREGTPPNIRTILKNIYSGHCQIYDFWFLKKNMEPFFEIHHIDRSTNHNLKNLVVVCGNCHNEFEHADVLHEFNDDHWLTKVSFNGKLFKVRQAIDRIEKAEFYKQVFV